MVELWAKRVATTAHLRGRSFLFDEVLRSALGHKTGTFSFTPPIGFIRVLLGAFYRVALHIYERLASQLMGLRPKRRGGRPRQGGENTQAQSHYCWRVGITRQTKMYEK